MALAIPTGTATRPTVAIPKILHRVWLGGPLPEEFEEFGRGWQRHHPAWQLKLWTEDTLPTLRNQELFDAATTAAGKADIARYELLARFGGVYIDCDFECLRPIDELIEGVDGFAAFEDDEWVAIGIMGCVPGHPLFDAVVTQLPRSVAARAGQPVNEQTGPRFFTPFAVAHEQDDPHFRLFEPALFYPYLYDEPQRRGEHFPDAFAVHHWSYSWGEPPASPSPARFVLGVTFADPTAILPALATYVRLFTPADDVELCLLVHGALAPDGAATLQQLVHDAAPETAGELASIVAYTPDEVTADGIRAAYVPCGDREIDARRLAAFLAATHELAAALRSGRQLAAVGAPAGWNEAPSAAASTLPAPLAPALPAAPPRPSYGTYLGNDRLLISTTWGGTLLTFASDLGLTPDLVTDGQYDPAFTNWLQRALKPGHVAWDVGANIGYFTLLMAQLVGERGSVVAWEANPPTHALLVESLTMNYLLDRVEARAVAVAEHEGTLAFHSMSRFVGCGSLRAPDDAHYERFPVDEASVLEVPTEPLDRFLETTDHVDLVKIDVEGAELGVLRGMRGLLAAGKVGTVAFELLRETMGEDWEPTCGLLRGYADAGYRFATPCADGSEEATTVEHVLAVAAFPQVLMRPPA
ncbi:MAG: methyltransferase FkbM family [Conexibacter sp.]|nr:methyltransferase FkbM family [Conexibacter sp.]